MVFKFRVILDTQQDVFRDIEIGGQSFLLDLHTCIKEAFDLPGDEMASFFLSNDEWFQGSEIPMEDMMGEKDAEIMANTAVSSVVSGKGGRVIYVYDFFSMWTFFCEVIEVRENDKLDTPKVVFSYGERPEEAPVTEKMHSTLEDDFMDDEDDDDYYEEEDPYSFY